MVPMRTAIASDMANLRKIDSLCFPTSDPDAVAARPGELEQGVERGEIIVSESEGVPVGFLHACWVDPGKIEIRALAVEPSARRRGVGSRLVEHLLDTVTRPRGRVPPAVTTVTSPKNLPMLTLLTSLGFVAGDLRMDHYGWGRHRLVLRHAPARVARLRGLSDHRRLPRADLVGLGRAIEGGGSDVFAVAGRYFIAGSTVGRATSPSRGRAAKPRSLASRFRPGGQDSTVGFTPMSLAETLTTTTTSPVRRNDDAPWGDFNPHAYWKRNYASIQAADREIVGKVGQFFSEVINPSDFASLDAVDAGTGTNLYPALAMLPFARSITLSDISPANVDWLRDSLADQAEPWPWQEFWNQLTTVGDGQVYSSSINARDVLWQRANPLVESVLELRPRRWDVGTMFFVAESITADRDEFRQAVARFLDSLKPGSPFAAAFMAGSTGYRVDDELFPAVSVDRDDIELIMSQMTSRCCLPTWIAKNAQDRVRDPRDMNTYEGMILITGFTE